MAYEPLADPKVYVRTNRLSALTRYDMCFRITSIAIGSFGCLAACALVAHPGREPFSGVWLLLAAFLAFCVQLLAALLTLTVPVLRCHRRLSGVLVCAWLTIIACCQTLIPLRARVLISEPWLRPEVKRLLHQPSPRVHSSAFGLFRFIGGWQRNGVAYLSTGPYGMFGGAGLAYAPAGFGAGASLTKPVYSYDHLYGPWWRYSFVDD